MLRKFLMLPSVLMLVVLCAAASPQGDNLVITFHDDSKTLTGVPGLHLHIEELPKALDGEISADDIRTDVELKLRQSGIRILTEEDDDREEAASRREKRHDNRGGGLNIEVNALKSSTGGYAYNASIGYGDTGTINRGRLNIIVIGSTIWKRSAIGTVGSGNARVIRDTVKDLVDQFCNDYLKANPKK